MKPQKSLVQVNICWNNIYKNKISKSLHQHITLIGQLNIKVIKKIQKINKTFVKIFHMCNKN